MPKSKKTAKLPEVKLGEDIDPRLFEWDPEEPPEEEIYESMARRKVNPNVLVDPKDRARYIAFLKTFRDIGD